MLSLAGGIDCKDLKEGIFKLESVDSSVHVIVRTKDKQRESVSKTGLESEFDIIWTSDCTFLLLNRRVIWGRDDLPPDANIDTLYNEITYIKGDKHTVISTLKTFNFKVEAILIKLDPKLLYSDIRDIKKFSYLDEDNYSWRALGHDYSALAQRSSHNKSELLLAFQEELYYERNTIRKLIDYRTLKLEPNQNLALKNCRYNNQYDEEVIAHYISKNDNEEAKIIKAWRFNRNTRKIENINNGKVKYKVADQDKFF